MDTPKIRVVILSHGDQAKGMLNTLQMLLGEQENVAAYGLYPDQTVNDLVEVLKKEVERYGAENLIFMSDLKLGSPFNAVVALTREHEIYHITGTNLATLLTVITERDEEDASPAEICAAALETAKESILDVRKMLECEADEEEEEL